MSIDKRSGQRQVMEGIIWEVFVLLGALDRFDGVPELSYERPPDEFFAYITA